MKTIQKQRYRITILIILIFVLAVISVRIVLDHMQSEVKLSYYNTYKFKIDHKIDDNEYDAWWDIIYDDMRSSNLNKPEFDLNNLDLSEVDFNKYNVVLSQGRKILEIKYIRSFHFPYLKKNGAAVAHVENIYYDDTVFVYLADKTSHLRIDPKIGHNSCYIIKGTSENSN